MSRIVPLLSVCCLAAIGLTAVEMMSTEGAADVAIPALDKASDDGTDAPAITIDRARRSYDRATLDTTVDRLRELAASTPQDSESWKSLAEALIYRARLPAHRLGLRPGHPVWSEIPSGVLTDLDEAQLAIARARQLGDDSGELHRMSAEVMSQRITGIGSALRWNGKIEEEIEKAAERAPNDPKLHLVLGLRKLMAPRFLGHDPEKALEHLTYAAKAMPDDERPAVFAAMACHLMKRRLEAITWLEKAVRRNPANAFARVVLRRVRRGEAEPFGRDITPEEEASATLVR